MDKLTIVLDNLRSCHNVGSIIRTAEGFGCRRFAFVGITPHPELAADQRLAHQIRAQTAKISKTSLGAEVDIAGRHFPTPDEFLRTAGDGVITCLEQTPQSIKLAAWQPRGRSYLVFGNELQGVSSALLKAAGLVVTIPMRGRKESFNVAVAAGIALYHAQLNWQA